jgi:hypothetical protein
MPLFCDNISTDLQLQARNFIGKYFEIIKPQTLLFKLIPLQPCYQ